MKSFGQTIPSKPSTIQNYFSKSDSKESNDNISDNILCTRSESIQFWSTILPYPCTGSNMFEFSEIQDYNFMPDNFRITRYNSASIYAMRYFVDFILDFTGGLCTPVEAFNAKFPIYNFKLVTAAKGILGYPIVEATVHKPDSTTLSHIFLQLSFNTQLNHTLKS